MAGFGRAGRLAALGALLTGLAACSSFGGLSSSRPAEGAIVTTGDLAAALFAVDMPASVEPGERGPRVIYGDALDVTLVRADAEPVMAALPPPPEGRSYAVYAFAEADRPAVAAAVSQLGARIVVSPGLCLTPAADRSKDTVTVLAVLPEKPPVTLMAPESLAAIEARLGAQFPVCAGHSG